MKANVYTFEGKAKGSIDLPQEVFGVEIKESLMHSVVMSYLANQRQGTSKTKTRAEVSGGGRKPWRQKGTGRARAGSNTSPVWARGSKAHGAIPRDYDLKVNKKARREALCSAYTVRASEELVKVIDAIDLNKPKTKSIADLLTALSINGKRNLLIVNSADKNIYLSARNIKNVDIKCVTDVNTYDILSNENIVFCNEALVEKVKEVVKK